MELFLSRNSTTNTVLTDASNTRQYKIETPFKFVGRVTTIQKFIYNDRNPDMSHSSDSALLTDKDTVVQSDSREEKFMELAEISWRIFASSSLRFGAMEVDMSEYLAPEGFFRRTRVFNGPDGRSYRWTLGHANSTLEACYDPKTPIARTHRSCFGFFGKARQASLEIYPSGQHMIDVIVVTWCYVETLRREREKNHNGS